LLGDLVITAAEELDQAEAVAEGIGQQDNLAPGSLTPNRPRSWTSIHG